MCEMVQFAKLLN